MLLYILPTMIFTHLFIKDTNKLVNILLNVSHDSKEDAKKPVLKEYTIEMFQPTEKKTKM